MKAILLTLVFVIGCADEAPMRGCVESGDSWPDDYGTDEGEGIDDGDTVDGDTVYRDTDLVIPDTDRLDTHAEIEDTDTVSVDDTGEPADTDTGLDSEPDTDTGIDTGVDTGMDTGVDTSEPLPPCVWPFVCYPVSFLPDGTCGSLSEYTGVPGVDVDASCEEEGHLCCNPSGQGADTDTDTGEDTDTVDTDTVDTDTELPLCPWACTKSSPWSCENVLGVPYRPEYRCNTSDGNCCEIGDPL